MFILLYECCTRYLGQPNWRHKRLDHKWLRPFYRYCRPLVTHEAPGGFKHTYAYLWVFPVDARDIWGVMGVHFTIKYSFENFTKCSNLHRKFNFGNIPPAWRQFNKLFFCWKLYEMDTYAHKSQCFQHLPNSRGWMLIH